MNNVDHMAQELVREYVALFNSNVPQLKATFAKHKDYAEMFDELDRRDMYQKAINAICGLHGWEVMMDDLFMTVCFNSMV